jgi:hypothetical protein
MSEDNQNNNQSVPASTPASTPQPQPQPQTANEPVVLPTPNNTETFTKGAKSKE